MKELLHNEARELLVKGYEKSGDAKAIAAAYSVSERTVYRLAQQKRETGSVALRTCQRGQKPLLTAEDKEDIRKSMDKEPDSRRYKKTGTGCQLFHSRASDLVSGLYVEKEIAVRK